MIKISPPHEMPPSTPASLLLQGLSVSLLFVPPEPGQTLNPAPAFLIGSFLVCLISGRSRMDFPTVRSFQEWIYFEPGRGEVGGVRGGFTSSLLRPRK